MKEAESTAHRITSTLTTDNTNRIPEQVKTNTQRVFNTTKDRQKYKFEKLLREKQAAVSPSDTPYVDKTNWVLQQLSNQSLTSRRNWETRSKTSKRTIPSWFSQRTKGALASSWIPTPTTLRCLTSSRTDRTSSYKKTRQTVLPGSCPRSG